MDSEQEQGGTGAHTNPFDTKVGAGQRKRYYKGGRPKLRGKHRRKADLIDLTHAKNKPVVFQDKGGTFLAWVDDEICKGEYLVRSIKPGDDDQVHVCTTAVNSENRPVLLELIKIEKGAHVLFTWDCVPGKFVELRPAVVLCEMDEFVWLKPKNVHALRVAKDELCKCPYDTELDEVDDGVNNVSQSDVDVVKMIVEQYETAVKETQLSYEKAKQQLTNANIEKTILSEMLYDLNVLYANALKTTTELKKALFESERTRKAYSCRIRSLLGILATDKQVLDQKRSQIFWQHKDIMSFRSKIQSIENEKGKLLEALVASQEKWERTEEERSKLAQENKELKDRNKRLEGETSTLRTREMLHLEQRPSTSAGHSIILARPAVSKTKPSAYLPLPLPQTPSSLANPKTLDARAKELLKLIEVISAREAPTESDLVATLATFFRMYPSLASMSCQVADISMYKELTAGETLDLKVLLRLPMRKFRQLRTFFRNQGIRVFSSDRAVYKEKAGRRDTSEAFIEVGELPLKKTVAATETASVPFVRIRNLGKHIQSLLEKQLASGETWDHCNFHGEIWIKILGDKGGSSTKLAVQICNLTDSNSADKTDLLGMFEATDSYENMSQVFLPFREQVLELQRNSMITIGKDVKICRLFLVGDYEFLTKVMGHMGPHASFPCLWCYLPLQALSPGGPLHCPMIKDGDEYVANPQWYTNREPGDIVQDLADNKSDPRNGGNTKANGRNHNSIANEAIFPILYDLAHIIPPILHIMLGLVVRFYKCLEEICKQKDRGNINEEDEGLYNEWMNVSVNAEEKGREYDEAVAVQKHEEKLLAAFEKVRSGARGTGSQDPCAYPACAVAAMGSIVQGEIGWVQCDVCGDDGTINGWYHTVCVRKKDEDLRDVQYECPVCSGHVENVEDVVNMQKRIVREQKDMLSELKKSRDTAKVRLDKVFEQVNATMGPLERDMRRVLESELGVQKQAYHSQCFVGNHCKTILENSDKLMTVLEGHEEKGIYAELFVRLRDIFRYTRGSFLTNAEVDALCEKCWDLGRWFPLNFPAQRIPPKLHFLICHVPECAKMWHTVGLLSEHGIESLHAQVNADERVYCSVRDNKTRMKLVFCQHGQRMMANKDTLKTQRRKCANEDCKGRYKTVKGIRRCQICNEVDK